ncbi:ATP-dependent zinc metalloprotease FtsH [Candidatus Absconditicoccus praedator]|uniref:ATP-dependent zinc metalloprotease FtsH n=1 Tax=Candidatus Absconditicoccus praedator TaxID=2735562 RepID=UPI001E5DB50E|nr:ATP-dependent zinc metalloprotease FtsH [Candidatus Absconditicoccus praedator]UFX83459.1 ATP-dependent zinc metalloprotease FtsH [Candidatus Absconditicoccus praedator]
MKKGIILFIGFILVSSILLYNTQQQEYTNLEDGTKAIEKISEKNEIDLNNFLKLYEDNEFDKVRVIDGKKLHGLIEIEIIETTHIIGYKIPQVNYKKFTTKKPEETTISELGIDPRKETSITVKYDERGVLASVFLETLLPLLLLVLLLIFLFRLFAPKGGGGFPFSSTQAGKLQQKDDIKAKFKDVAGMDESKNELEEIVDYLKNPTKYKKVGAKIPRGVLLYGPPGSGKTLVARAVAGEADVPFFSSSGSEFMEMLVGMGAAKVRELFNKAKNAAPAIIFIDEIDTIGKRRGSGQTGGHQEQEQTLNQILTEMDGFNKDTNVIVLAATNRPDMLDKALLRPGRFDRKVYVGTPTLEERIDILKVHTGDKKLSKSVDLETIARRTSGFVGADLENLANEAAIKVARERRKILTNEDFEYALEKVIMGPEKKIKTMKEKEKQIITYHELGHAVTAYMLPNADPVEKISIVSRGMALGVTWMMPQEDTYLNSKAKFLDQLVTLLGGRVAEELIFGKEEITTGASNDFEKVTQIASDMIMKYGMDDELGTINYKQREQQDMQVYRPYSEETTKKIDEKIFNIVNEAYEKAKKILQDNMDTIERLAKLLYEKEYISKEEFEEIMQKPEKADEMYEDFIEKQKEKSKQDKQVQEEEEEDDEDTEEDNKEKEKNRLEDMLDRFLKKGKDSDNK